MPRILILEELTVGKIAAGEVVDRPASVVKELVENSLDAGSRRVVVEVGNGGRDYIRVTDDGCGICEADAETAFKKHATSKIAKIEDLASLQTLGFRGEALPSIAAVSRVEISTRHESEDFGTFLRVEAGTTKERRRVTRAVGTTLQVKSLFYNLPARISTFKSRATELRRIIAVCTNYAVAYPEIKFELFHDGRLVLSTLGNGKMLDALVNAYGSSLGRELLELKEPAAPATSPLVQVRGFISKPAASYSTKKHLFTFVNRRFVRSELVEKAVKRGYGTLLPRHAYPFAVLSLRVPPSEVNVNIHPKKHEVSFYRPDEVFHAVAESVSTTLRNSDLIPEVVKKAETGSFSRQREKERQREKKAESEEKRRSRRDEAKHEILQTSFQFQRPTTEEVSKNEKEGGGTGGRAGTGTGRGSSELNIRAAPLYQVLDSYIVAQTDADDLILIDQHAAAERINFERLLEKYWQSGRRINNQTLLRPYLPELSPHQLYLLRENEEMLREMGFDLERFGEDGYVVRAIPVVFHGMLGEDEIIEVIERLVEGEGEVEVEVEGEESSKREKKEERLKVLFSTAACKASVKAGEKLSYEGMREIVRGLKAAKMPFTCPHGRPTMIRLTKREIEKRFKRR